MIHAAVEACVQFVPQVIGYTIISAIILVQRGLTLILEQPVQVISPLKIKENSEFFRLRIK